MNLYKKAVQCLEAADPLSFVEFSWELGLYALSLPEEITDTLVSQLCQIMRTPQFLQHETSSELIMQLIEHWRNFPDRHQNELLTTTVTCVPQITSKRAAFMAIVLICLIDGSPYAFQLLKSLAQDGASITKVVIYGLGFFMIQDKDRGIASEAEGLLRSVDQSHTPDAIRVLAANVILACRNRTGMFAPDVNWRDL